MSSYFRLLENINKSTALILKYNPKNIFSIKKELEQSVENRKLQIMLYGAYNAGKSTLINTLLGYYAAAVNDIPTTDKVERYNWGGFYLIDTPGVNAPIIHEEITTEQVKRTNAMLFVIREGDQDAKNIYERLFSMLKNGKKIFIILNHQLIDSNDKQAAVSIVSRILCMLAEQYDLKDIDISNITVLPMNVCTAYNGRLKNNERLLEHSGYNEFVQKFHDWSNIQNQESQQLVSLKNQINDLWYGPILSQIKSKLDQIENSAIRDLRDEQLIIISEKNLLQTQSGQYITQQVNLLKSNVSHALQGAQSQSALDSNLQSIFLPLIPNLETWLSNEIGRISSKLAIPINYNYEAYRDDEKEVNAFTKNLIADANNAFKDKENLKQALLLGRKLKIPFLKGRWEKTIGNWAGKAAFAVQVLSCIYDIYKANAEQKQENIENRQRSIELYQAVEEICTSIIIDFTNTVNAAISVVFDQKIKDLQIRLDAISKNESDIKTDYNLLNQLMSEMFSIEFSQ